MSCCKECRYFSTQIVIERRDNAEPGALTVMYKDVEVAVPACRQVAPVISNIYAPTWPIVREEDWCSHFSNIPFPGRPPKPQGPC